MKFNEAKQELLSARQGVIEQITDTIPIQIGDLEKLLQIARRCNLNTTESGIVGILTIEIQNATKSL
jgi:hypothetical protein